MTSLSIFEFNCNQVRVISIDGEPWFVAKDVCNILEIKNVSDALSRLDEDEKQELPYDMVIGLSDDLSITRLLAVSESGMYALVLSSRKPEAKPFRKWVTSEVLPSIRKNGSYAIAQNSQKDLIEIAHAALDGIFSNVPIKPELVAGLKLNATQKLIPQLAPVLEDSRHLLAINTAQEFELLTPTQIGEQLGLSARKVNQLLIDKGFQVKNEARTSRKQSPYLPTAKGLEFADLTLSTGKGNDSTSYQQLRWYSSVLNQI